MDSDQIKWSLSLVNSGRLRGWDFATLYGYILREEQSRNALDTMNPDKVFCDRGVLEGLLEILLVLEG